MTITIPTVEPTEKTAGDTWKWTRSLSDYPASLWTLTYYLLGPTVLDSGNGVEATADGDDHSIEIAASDTAPLEAGEYTLVGFIVEDATSERTEVYRAPLRVNANAATLAASAQKTHAETMYEAVVAKIEGRLTKDQEQIVINGRTIVRIPITELQKLRGKYAAMIRAERNPTGLPGPRVEVRF